MWREREHQMDHRNIKQHRNRVENSLETWGNGIEFRCGFRTLAVMTEQCTNSPDGK